MMRVTSVRMAVGWLMAGAMGWMAMVGRAEDARPNIILIMADDMGYECLGCNGGLDYETPQLDSLAGQGIRFGHCYSLPICTPSRVKIMTGRYSYRNYERFGLLPPTEETFGTRLREAGYRTCMVGKWQLGGDWTTPTAFGFDEYCLQNGIVPKEKFDRSTRGPSRYWGYPAIVANGELYESEHRFGPDMLNEYAVGFIKKEKDRPFFLYYPMLLTHSPFEPSPLTPGGAGKDGRTSEVRFFKDMVEYTDHLVGNILRALDESGQRENTLIMFTGDNGTTYPVGVTATNPGVRRMAAASGRVGVLREAGERSPQVDHKKHEAIEGPVTRTTYGDVPGGKDLMTASGTHVPLVVDWPKHAAAYKKIGNVSEDLVDFTDFLATFMELAGVAADRSVDGVSFADLLTGKGPGAREFVFCHYWHFGRDPERAREAIHDGRWKLYNDGRFYDVSTDLDEEKPLDLKQMPEAAAEAHRRLTKAYEALRGLPIPNDAPSKRYAAAKAGELEGWTLEKQLARARARAAKGGASFDEARSRRYFRAKDRNKDGVLDEEEQKAKPPKDWNKQG